MQTKIINQMDLWDNEDCETQPGDDKPHGQKCLLVSSSIASTVGYLCSAGTTTPGVTAW